MSHRDLLVKQSRIVVMCALVGLLALNSTSAADPEPEPVEVEFVIQITSTENETANITVPGTPARAITILVDAIVDGTEYELGSVRCEYYADADMPFDGAFMSATAPASANLVVDAMVTGDGFAATGLYNGSFTVTVAYH